MRTSCDDKRTDWIEEAASQRISKIDSKSPEVRKRQGKIPLQVSEGHDYAKTFILDSASRTVEQCISVPILWYVVTAALENKYMVFDYILDFLLKIIPI